MNILDCKEVKCVLHSVLMAIEKELKDIDALRYACVSVIIIRWNTSHFDNIM